MASVSALAFSISQKRPNSLYPTLHTDIWGIKDLLINPIRGEIYVAASLPKWLSGQSIRRERAQMGLYTGQKKINIPQSFYQLPHKQPGFPALVAMDTS